MRDPFLAAVDAAVARSLPGTWPRLPRGWLPARGRARVRHAFRLAGGAVPGPYLAIVALPCWASPIAALQCDLVELVGHVLARGANLLLLEEGPEGPGDPGDTGRGGGGPEVFDFPHPHFLAVSCVSGRRLLAPGGTGGGRSSPRELPPDLYLATLDGDRWEPLWAPIHDLWSGRLAYQRAIGWRRTGAPVRSWGQILGAWLDEQD